MIDPDAPPAPPAQPASPLSPRTALARCWWLFVLRGVVSILFGVTALVWPAITAVAFVLLFAAWAIVDGVSSLVAALRDVEKGREALLLGVEGLLGIAAGVVAFVWPEPTLVVVALVAGAWAIVTGVLEIIAAIRLRREIRGELLLALAGGASIVVGIVLVRFPIAGILGLAVLLAAYAVVFGAVLIGLGIRLWHVRPAESQTR